MHRTLGFRRLWAIMAVPVALWLAAPALQAQQPQGESTVHAVGGSRIHGGNLSAAREEAINAGLAAAVHRVLADLLPPETITGNFQAINEAILNRTDQFVRDYRVIAQSTHASHYRAVVQATVSVKRLKEALKAAGIGQEERQYPRVLFCIAEKRLDDLAPRYWWSGRPAPGDTTAGATLARAFAEAGFLVVQPGAAAGAAGYPPELRGTEAVALGRQLQAEVVVAGLAMVEEMGVSGTREAPSYRGSITARAYRVSDGEQIAQTHRAVQVAVDEAQPNGGEALRNAAALAAKDLAAQTGSAWFKQAAAGTRIELVVHGISGNIANFVRFRGALADLSGVERLQIKEMMADTATLSVDYQGNSRALADALLQLGFETFRISIGQLDANAIHLQLLPR
jgi:hypothetical protein